MSEQFSMDLSAAVPPDDFPPPRQALWWLAKGSLALGREWDQAHEICQNAEGDAAHDRIHGLCHLIEGDAGNAAYWFRRAGMVPETSDAAAVWQEIATSLP